LDKKHLASDVEKVGKWAGWFCRRFSTPSHPYCIP